MTVSEKKWQKRRKPLNMIDPMANQINPFEAMTDGEQSGTCDEYNINFGKQAKMQLHGFRPNASPEEMVLAEFK